MANNQVYNGNFYAEETGTAFMAYCLVCDRLDAIWESEEDDRCVDCKSDLRDQLEELNETREKNDGNKRTDT